MKFNYLIFTVVITLICGCSHSHLKDNTPVYESKSLNPSITIHSSQGDVLLDSITNCSQENKNGQTDIRC